MIEPLHLCGFILQDLHLLHISERFSESSKFSLIRFQNGDTIYHVVPVFWVSKDKDYTNWGIFWLGMKFQRKLSFNFTGIYKLSWVAYHEDASRTRHHFLPLYFSYLKKSAGRSMMFIFFGLIYIVRTRDSTELRVLYRFPSIKLFVDLL